MINEQDFEYVRSTVRQVPNFPHEGILFLDITTATKDAKSMQLMVDFLYEKFKDEKIDYIAGVESRGFIFGAALFGILWIAEAWNCIRFISVCFDSSWTQ